MHVWVLMGGWASEREVSLTSGRAVCAALRERGHRVLAYELAEGRLLEAESTPGALFEDLSAASGTPLERPAAGPPPGWAARLLATAETMRGRLEVAFLALHGGVGEDGTVQALLHAAGFPYTGSGPAASAVAMDKCLTKLLMQAIGVGTPAWTLLARPAPGEAPPALVALAGTPVVGLPVVVKPVSEGSSVGVSVVFEPGEWEKAFQAAAGAAPADRPTAGGVVEQLLVEQYIPGRELTVGILDGQVLPVVEIAPREGWYDFGNKYGEGRTSYEVPARLPVDVERLIKDDAARLYSTLGCRGMARVDFRYPGDGPPQCLELNAIPGLTGTSLLPKAARAAGIGFGELLETICRAGVRDHGGAARA